MQNWPLPTNHLKFLWCYSILKRLMYKLQFLMHPDFVSVMSVMRRRIGIFQALRNHRIINVCCIYAREWERSWTTFVTWFVGSSTINAHTINLWSDMRYPGNFYIWGLRYTDTGTQNCRLLHKPYWNRATLGRDYIQLKSE